MQVSGKQDTYRLFWDQRGFVEANLFFVEKKRQTEWHNYDWINN